MGEPFLLPWLRRWITRPTVTPGKAESSVGPGCVNRVNLKVLVHCRDRFLLLLKIPHLLQEDTNFLGGSVWLLSWTRKTTWTGSRASTDLGR